MTFEEFFAKKKIDLVQFQRADPDLYDEFRVHFAQMGEKSFDHTKKYWFNRLRKIYLLEETAPAPLKSATAAVDKTPPVGAPGTKPAGFKPRFKPAAMKADAPTEAHESEPKQEEAPKKAATPTGFKPRFKPAAVKPETPTEAHESEPKQEEAPKKAATPTGFKPRFKPGITNTKKDDPEN